MHVMKARFVPNPRSVSEWIFSVRRRNRWRELRNVKGSVDSEMKDPRAKLSSGTRPELRLSFALGPCGVPYVTFAPICAREVLLPRPMKRISNRSNIFVSLGQG